MKSKLNWLEAVLLLAPFCILALYWTSIPTRVPMHWNFRGEIDSWSPKMPGLLLAPLLGLGVVVLLRNLRKFDPKLERTFAETGHMRGVLPIIRIALLGLFDVILYVQIAVSLGWKVNDERIFTAAILIFLAVMGNYLGNLRPNYFAGIRTPWTLENPETWRATHRVGGRLMFFGALVLLVLQFFLSNRLFGWVFGASILLLASWAFLYSWHYWRTHIANT
jgi:uncharacterized membrane protein